MFIILLAFRFRYKHKMLIIQKNQIKTIIENNINVSPPFEAHYGVLRFAAVAKVANW